MTSPVPVPPKNLNPFARELLEALAGHPEAAEIVIGGGVALSHYLEYRGTVDLDAWWRHKPVEGCRALIRRLIEEMGVKYGLEFRFRVFGEMESFELLNGRQKSFSCQISERTLYLQGVMPSPWPPLHIETLEDNLASKMSALVRRGAPRDFMDVYELCRSGMVTPEQCWELWQRKNPDELPVTGAGMIISHLQGIEMRRPLETVSTGEREKARLVRAWIRDILCAPHRHDP